MKITTKLDSNVDFNKLITNLTKITNKALSNAAKDSSEVTKINIQNSNDNKGGMLKPLSKVTKNVRKNGSLRGNIIPKNKRQFALFKRLPNVGGEKPLFYTGALLSSINSKKNNLVMAGYGAEHNEGFTFQTTSLQTGKTVSRDVPPRPFIEFFVSDKTKDIFLKDLDKGLSK